MRICSFLPSGTEMACLLGLEKDLAAVTHECDFPASVKSLPRIVTSRIDPKNTPQSEIDRLVSELLKKGESLYQINEEMLLDLKPDLIITQDLCQVCAPSGNDAAQVLKKLPAQTRVLYLTPNTLDGIFENIMELSQATATETIAAQKVSDFKKRISAVVQKTQSLIPKSVFMMEWVDPPYCSGHWLPEMTQSAGGHDLLALKGKDSTRIPWEKIVEYNPEIFVVAPCGYHLDGAVKIAEELLPKFPNLTKLKAYQQGQIYAVDADSYFVRPGPRVVEGIEILAKIFHPALFKDTAPPDSYRTILL